MPALVSFTIDNLGDAADLQRGLIRSPRKAGENPPLERGYPALLALFANYHIPLTCFVEGWSADRYPDQLQELARLGHEIGMHGWQHEDWSRLAPAAVEELAGRATASLHAATGRAPRAFRAPGGLSTPHTRQVLGRLGYTVDASYTGATRIVREGGLTCIPYQWSGVDATHWLWNRRDLAEVERRWQAALGEAAENAGHYVFIWHPHVMGLHPERLEAGDRTIRFVLKDPRFRIVPLAELAAAVVNPPASQTPPC